VFRCGKDLFWKMLCVCRDIFRAHTHDKCDHIKTGTEMEWLLERDTASHGPMKINLNNHRVFHTKALTDIAKSRFRFRYFFKCCAFQNPFYLLSM